MLCFEVLQKALAVQPCLPWTPKAYLLALAGLAAQLLRLNLGKSGQGWAIPPPLGLRPQSQGPPTSCHVCERGAFHHTPGLTAK